MKTRIMTSNILGDYFGNPVEERTQSFINIFTRYAPDIIGIQEATTHRCKSELFDWFANNYYLAGFEHFAGGKPTTEDKTGSIDHIVAYGKGYKSKVYAIITDQDALDSSDHSPVYADTELV